jgi:hypothetical protein
MFRLLRLLLILEFLIAIEVVFTFWSYVGGQYHLDLMFWPWKFGISLVAAGLITAITADLTRESGVRRRRVWVLGGLLIVTVILAGAVTYYYHLNEPTDDDEDSDQPARVTGLESPYTGSYRAIISMESHAIHIDPDRRADAEVFE